MTNNEKNRFMTLNTVDVGTHTEKKNGLTYLSWAWAWAEFKKLYPNSYYTIYENNDGWNYFTDSKTCWVKTGVTMVDGDFKLEHIEYLPIMDFKNKSIPVGNVTSTDVNKTIQRSLTKAVARHGLGLYIYAGEDLPEEDPGEKARKDELKTSIDAKARQMTASMSKPEQKAFFDKYIKPIIGDYNYNACNDMSKLQKLSDNLAKAS